MLQVKGPCYGTMALWSAVQCCAGYPRFTDVTTNELWFRLVSGLTLPRPVTTIPSVPFSYPPNSLPTGIFCPTP